MLSIGAQGRLLIAIIAATCVFILSRSWTTQLATRPIKPVTKNSCPAEFFIVAKKPDGQYTLMALFEYSDELKSDFYRESRDRNRTRPLLQETWPTADVLWPDFSDVSLQLSETDIEDAESFVNASLAKTHEEFGLFPTMIRYQVDAVNRLSSNPSYKLVIERGHFPEIYLYHVDDGEFVPDAYILENRIGGLFVSSLLSAISLLLILSSSPLGRLFCSNSR